MLFRSVDVQGNRNGGSLSFSADATEAAFRYGLETVKPIGVDASCSANITSGELAGLFDIHNSHFALGESSVTCAGTLYSHRRIPTSLADIAGAVLHVEAQSRTLANLAELVPVPELRQLRLSGGVTMAIDIAADGYGTEIEEGQLIFDDLRVDYQGTPLSLSGAVALSHRQLKADGLQVSAGDSTTTLAADIASPFERPRGSLEVSGNYFNLERLLQAMRVEPVSPAVAAGDAGDGNAATETIPPQGIPNQWPQVRRFLNQCDIDARVAFDRFIWQDDVGVTYDWQAFSSQFGLRRGRLDVHDFKAVWRGGVVTGAVGIDMTQPNPEVHTRYAIRNIAAGPEIQPLINYQFPDMIVKGRINQVYDAREKLFKTADEPGYPVGATLFEAFDGTMSGQAAPKWLTDLIPGLSMSTYKFDRMQSIGQLQADGRADNRMLFEGSPYSLYIDGHTEADGTALYTLGVDLMNSLDRGSTVRALEQGRVPIVEFKGRIVDSAWQGLEVRFKLPHEVAYDVLLRRNLLVRLLSSRGEAKRPDFTPYRFSDDGKRRPPSAE